MNSVLESIGEYFGNFRAETWRWFAGLNREEWLVLLAFVCACGFLSLRGMTSRRL
jgi:hypothetical protein